MFEYALRSTSSSQALTACSHVYHNVNHWRGRIIDTPRVWRVRGHRIPEYQRAPRQHDELLKDYNILSLLPLYRSGPYCYEDRRVQSYHGQLCAYKEATTLDRYELEGKLKPRRLWQIVSGAVTRWRNRALIHCRRQPGVHWATGGSCLHKFQQQPGDSTSHSTSRHAA